MGKPFLQQIADGGPILVVGLGISGFAMARYLHRQGYAVLVSDCRPFDALPEGYRQWLDRHQVEMETGGHSDEFFAAAAGVVVSPGVPLELPALAAVRARQIPVIGELGLAVQLVTAPIIAVTGTNGKSTVTTMIGAMLQAAGKRVVVAGNIGVPLISLVQEQRHPDYVVLEVSSFQLDTMECFAPHVAVLLNISADHQDRYPDYEAYVASKLRIFAGQRSTDWAVVNGDDQGIARAIAGRSIAANRVSFSRRGHGAHCVLRGREICLAPFAADDDTVTCPLPARMAAGPDGENAMAAVLVGKVLGITPPAMVQALADFVGLPHRMQFVATVDGVDYVDDSKATNSGAVAAALAAATAPVVLLAGGLAKEDDFSHLGPLVRKHVRAMVVFGRAATLLTDQLADCTRIVRAKDLPGAVAAASEWARPGDTVLLSPACASFDMFSSYHHRGQVFVAAVRRLEKTAKQQGTASAVPHGSNRRTAYVL